MAEWIKDKHETESSIGWQAGVYVRDAIACNFSKSNHYPERPISFYADTVRYDDDEEQYEFTDADRFGAFAMMFNKRFPTPEPEEAKEDTPEQPIDQ